MEQNYNQIRSEAKYYGIDWKTLIFLVYIKALEKQIINYLYCFCCSSVKRKELLIYMSFQSNYELFAIRMIHTAMRQTSHHIH